MLKAILETLDGLSADVAAHYAEKDGKFYLSVKTVGGFGLEDISGLKSALGKERASVKELGRQVKGFEGLDADKARDALARLEKLAKADPEGRAKAQVEALRTQLVDKHTAEMAVKEELLGAVTAQLGKHLVENEVRTALEKAGANVDLMLPHLMSRTKMRHDEASDRYVTEVLDANGHPAVNSDGSGMSVTQLAEEFKTQSAFASAYKGTGSSGSGAGGGSVVAGQGRAQHRISAADAKDVQKYRAGLLVGGLTVEVYLVGRAAVQGLVWPLRIIPQHIQLDLLTHLRQP